LEGVMRSTLLGLFLLLSTCIQFADAQAEPKPLLFLWEAGGWGKPIGPNPYGLRLVLYDDGTLIFSDDTIDAMRGDVAPKFSSVTLARDAALGMAKTVRGKLDGVPTVIDGDRTVTDRARRSFRYGTGRKENSAATTRMGIPASQKGEIFRTRPPRAMAYG
jgi:hypothetical protein